VAECLAVVNPVWTIFSNSSVVMPEWRDSNDLENGGFAAGGARPLRSPLRQARAKRLLCPSTPDGWGARAFHAVEPRRRAENRSACSAHNVPSLSKVAIRSGFWHEVRRAVRGSRAFDEGYDWLS